MAKELTLEQMKQLRKHHLEALAGQHKPKIRVGKWLTLEEASKMLPGMIMQVTIVGKDVPPLVNHFS